MPAQDCGAQSRVRRESRRHASPWREATTDQSLALAGVGAGWCWRWLVLDLARARSCTCVRDQSPKGARPVPGTRCAARELGPRRGDAQAMPRSAPMANVPIEHTRSNEKPLKAATDQRPKETEPVAAAAQHRHRHRHRHRQRQRQRQRHPNIGMNIVIAGVLCIGLGTSTNIDTGIA